MQSFWPFHYWSLLFRFTLFKRVCCRVWGGTGTINLVATGGRWNYDVKADSTNVILPPWKIVKYQAVLWSLPVRYSGVCKFWSNFVATTNRKKQISWCMTVYYLSGAYFQLERKWWDILLHAGVKKKWWCAVHNDYSHASLLFWMRPYYYCTTLLQITDFLDKWMLRIRIL